MITEHPTVILALIAIITALAAAQSIRRLLWRQRLHAITPNEQQELQPHQTFLLAMLAVAIRHGASIPHALNVLGEIVRGELGAKLCRAAQCLQQGYSWHESWLTQCASGAFAQECRLLRDALAPSWLRGVSPVGRLESAVEELSAAEQAGFEQAAGKLSVRLLLPTGLCFLPAFICIGIVPAIASFIGAG